MERVSADDTPQEGEESGTVSDEDGAGPENLKVGERVRMLFPPEENSTSAASASNMTLELVGVVTAMGGDDGIKTSTTGEDVVTVTFPRYEGGTPLRWIGAATDVERVDDPIEAGTTEGDFEVHWEADYFFGHNLAIASANNFYLDGLGAPPEIASRAAPAAGDGSAIYLWMSDYHPDGGQLFWPREPVPFVVCLGSKEHGDDILPEHMRAFAVPEGRGVYIHPGTWHNGVYVSPAHAPATFLTRQGRVHARVSCSWAAERGTLLRVPLELT